MLNSQPQGNLLMILIDAFSQVYLSDKYTPFLRSLAETGVSSTLDPIFAFRGIETTIFTGVWPSSHNVWTEFKLAQQTRNSKKDRLLQQIVQALSLLPTDELQAKSRYFVERFLFKKFYKTLNIIPPRATQYFETSQSKETVETEIANSSVTLFDVFREMGIRFQYVVPGVLGDKGALHKAMRMIEENNRLSFCYLKFNHLDHLGHHFGPAPLMFRDQLAKIDRYVEQVVTLWQSKKPRLKVLILADHGMSKVYNTVNILKDLSQLRSQPYEDYVAFADSTMIRFWFFNEKAAHEIIDFVQEIECGHILSTKEKEFLKIPLDTAFGEMIYVLDEGYVIHPSFFASKHKVRGMHGYAYSKTPEALPVLLMNDEMANAYPANGNIRYVDIPRLVLLSFLPKIEGLNLDLSDCLRMQLHQLSGN